MSLPSEDEIISKWPRLSPPVVSLLGITYNHENYISTMLDGFLMQETTFPFEIVIGEDCSTDKTRDVIKSYQEKYPRLIRLVTGPKNIGFARNFSRALEACQGKYIAHCEGDDFWTDPQKLQIQFDFMEQNPEYVMCGHAASAALSDGVPLGGKGIKAKEQSAASLKFSTKLGLGNQTKFWRHVIKKLPPEALRVTTVDLFMSSMLGHFGKARFLDNIKPSVFRIHSTSIWGPLTEKKREKYRIQAYYLMSLYYAKRLKLLCSLYFFAGATYVLARRALSDLLAFVRLAKKSA
ncbi:MAG: glycosyltransferase [Bdellovibrionales bacterium]